MVKVVTFGGSGAKLGIKPGTLGLKVKRSDE